MNIKFSWKDFYNSPTPIILRKIGDNAMLACIGISTAFVQYDPVGKKDWIIGFTIAGVIIKAITNCFKNKD